MRRYRLTTCDNRDGEHATPVSKAQDSQGARIAPADIDDLLSLLRLYAGKPLNQWTEIGIHDLSVLDGSRPNRVADGSGQQPVFSLSGQSLCTGNVMGVVRLRDRASSIELTLQIGSRFDSEQRQLFLSYMLSKVFAGSFIDLVECGRHGLWQFLMALAVRSRLIAAYRQGLFKQYVRLEHNSPHFRGAANLPGHLRQNIPFCGTIAYTTHEFSYDNRITRLIRHALHRIAVKWPWVLSSADPLVTEARRVIDQHTPTWHVRDVLACRQQNVRPIRHPYFLKYEPLRRVCLSLLNDEGATLFADPTCHEAEGVVFDGAWLWEEYLARLLVPLGMTHFVCGGPNRLQPFIGAPSLYPDFVHRASGVVLDAKYKFRGNVEDLHQVLCYMYLTGALRGGLVFPPDLRSGYTPCVQRSINLCRGTGSHWGPEAQAIWYEIRFLVPESCDSAIAYRQRMAAAEEQFQTVARRCWET